MTTTALPTVDSPSTRERDATTTILFLLVTLGAAIGLPTYAYFYDYSWLDWTMFFVLYIFTGLGITVGYHRLLAHRSFDCPDWVKVMLLIGGGWAFQNSGLKWAADHIRHHARCDEDEDPYNATWGFFLAIVDGCLSGIPIVTRNMPLV